jgi:hypothetical protein
MRCGGEVGAGSEGDLAGLSDLGKACFSYIREKIKVRKVWISTLTRIHKVDKISQLGNSYRDQEELVRARERRFSALCTP